MATKAEERRNTIREFLESNPGAHSAEQVAEACGFTAADTTRALGQLARNGVIAETESDEHGASRWSAARTETAEASADDTTASPEATGPEAVDSEYGPDVDSAQSEPPTEAAAPDTATDPADPGEAAAAAGDNEDGQSDSEGKDAEAGSEVEPADVADAEPADGEVESGVADDDGEPTGGQDNAGAAESQAAEPETGGGEDAAADAADKAEPEPEAVPDPDPAVLLLASQLASIEGPVGLEAITLAAFKVAGAKTTETALHALCALAEHGALECSDPYSPDDRDRDEKVAWTVTVEPGELDRIAAIAQLADAPHATVCPTCQSEIALPHPKGVGRTKSAANERGDGRRRLADGELRQMLITLVKENPGEELKPGDFVRELKNDPRFKDRVSANPSGAVRSALIALQRKEHGEWVAEIEGRQPLTYRCREAQ